MVSESVTVESIAETLPKISWNADDKLQFPGKYHAQSFAECFTKEAEYFAEFFFSWSWFVLQAFC